MLSEEPASGPESEPLILDGAAQHVLRCRVGIQQGVRALTPATLRSCSMTVIALIMPGSAARTGGQAPGPGAHIGRFGFDGVRAG